MTDTNASELKHWQSLESRIQKNLARVKENIANLESQLYAVRKQIESLSTADTKKK